MVMVDHLRPGRLLQRDNISQGHQAVGLGTNIVLPQVPSIHAERLVGLHVHAVGAIVEVEIVYILRAHVNAEGLRDLTDRHSNSFGLFAIDLYQLLRIVRGEAGEQSSQIGSLAAATNDLVRNGVDILESIATEILQLKLESTKTSQALDRGWFERRHDRSGNREQFWRDSRHNIAGRVSFTFAVVNRLQRSEDEAVV